jgi:hypothetical protein
MVGPVAKREGVAHLQAVMGLSERPACSIVGADRKMIRYPTSPNALFRRASALANIRSSRSKLSSFCSNVCAVTSSFVSPALMRMPLTFFRALSSGRPPLTKRVPFEIRMTDTSQNLLHARRWWSSLGSCLDPPKPTDFPSQVDDIADKKFFDRVPRARGADDTFGRRGVIRLFLTGQQRRRRNSNDTVEDVGVPRTGDDCGRKLGALFRMTIVQGWRSPVLKDFSQMFNAVHS